jgi:hypothetical protein
MLLGDWLILIGVTLSIVGVIGWTLPDTGRGLGKGDFARGGRWRQPRIRDSISRLLLWWYQRGDRPAVLRANATKLRIDAHDLTDYACRLADGSMGRVAIVAGTDEEWMAVCVPK